MTSLERKSGSTPTRETPQTWEQRMQERRTWQEQRIQNFDATYGILPTEKLDPKVLRKRVRKILTRALKLTAILDRYNLELPVVDSDGKAWKSVTVDDHHLFLLYREPNSESTDFVEGLQLGIDGRSDAFVHHNLAWQRGNDNNECAMRYAEDSIDKLFSKTERALGINQPTNTVTTI